VVVIVIVCALAGGSAVVLSRGAGTAPSDNTAPSAVTPGNTAPSAVTLSSPSEDNYSSSAISWSKNNDSDFASYKIYYSTTPGVSTSSTLAATITNSATTTCTVTGLSQSTTYYFKVYVYDSGGLSSASNEESATTISKELVFVPDSGYRMYVENGSATNPNATISSGTFYLYYSRDGPNYQTTSTDGLTFGVGVTPPTTVQYHPRYLYMPDGRWRTYMPGQGAYVDSISTADGSWQSATLDSGHRYAGGSSDNGHFGILDVFPDPVAPNKYIMLYIGDIQGKNNLRRAVSIDNGMTFTYDRGNVLGDDNVVLASDRNVDQFSIELPGGERRLITMNTGGAYIDSFISDNEWDYFTKESGHRLSAGDFTAVGLTIYSLHDPTIVRLSDGRYRMYVCGRITNTGHSDNDEYAIVSATTLS
jgi:hypothetical protein